MNIVNINIEDVHPYEKNPRINEHGIEAVANSIKEFGWQQPIVVDRDHVIIAGHTRFFAAKHLGLTEVPVVIAENLSPEQVKAYRIADNKTGELSEWDFSLLSLELKDLQDANMDLNNLGFEDAELEEILAGDAENTVSEGETDPEAVPEVPETAVSKPGEIYQMGKHLLMCGDSTSEADVNYLMAGQKADMVFTDPPYGISYNGNPKGEEYEMIENDDLRGGSLTEFLGSVFRNMKTVLRDRGAFYIWYAPTNHIQFEQAIIDAGLRSKQILIWYKGMILGRSNYHYAHEPCFYGCHANSNCDWFGDYSQPTVWEVKRDNTRNPLHPNQKPPALAQIALFNSSKAGNIVLDLFGGSGSTLIACEQTGRVCRMMEFDPKYCDVIRRRWAEFTSGEGCNWQALNILITFASFERDLIIDRVKTAIEGGKKRGKFCGGVPMLGYRSDPYTKKLIVDPDEAKTVRLIFEKYVALESIQATVSEINRLGLRTREWVSVSTGKKHAAKPWNSTSIHRILTSPIYAGYVSHYDTNYEGEHEAIIPRPEWEKVQQMLEARSPLPRGQQRQRHFHPFDGHVICGHCNCALMPTYTKKQGRKYCYYICSRLNKDADHDCPVKRVPAGDLEHAVVSMLSGLFQAPSILRETLKAVRHKEELLRKNCERDVELLQAQLDEMKKQALKEDFNFEEVKKAADLLAEAKRKRNLLREPVSEDEVIAALGDAAGLWEFMFPGARHELLQLIVGDIVVYPDRISFVLKVDGLKDLASEMAVSGYFNEAHGDPAKLPETEQEILDDGSVRITMKMESKHIDGHRRVVIPAPGAERLKQTSLLRAINNARLWMDKLINGEAANVTDLSKQLGLKTGYVTRILSLNSLAPDIVEAILAGIEPDGLSIAKLTEQPIPEDWNEQRRLYGFPTR